MSGLEQRAGQGLANQGNKLENRAQTGHPNAGPNPTSGNQGYGGNVQGNPGQGQGYGNNQGGGFGGGAVQQGGGLGSGHDLILEVDLGALLLEWLREMLLSPLQLLIFMGLLMSLLLPGVSSLGQLRVLTQSEPCTYNKERICRPAFANAIFSTISPKMAHETLLSGVLLRFSPH